jgi:lipid A 3-O-deacylase
MRAGILPVLVLLSCTAFNARAARPPSESWTFTFRFENDLFANTDQHYTNGIKLSWTSPDLDRFKDLPWLQQDKAVQNTINAGLRKLPFSGDASRQRHVTLSLGQLIFTPRDIQTTQLIPDDRPYAGWLYGSVAFDTKTYNKLDSFEVQAGFTGELSLAEQAQNLVHSIRGIPTAKGWDNQIGNELAFAFIYDHKHRYIPNRDFVKKWGIDAISSVGFALGTAFTHASAGLEVRAGWNLPADFGTSLIRPGGETSAPADRADPRYQDKFQSFSFHIFAAAYGRAVARDIFLDGNTFAHSPSVDKKNYVADLIIGASLSYRRFKLAYSHVLRTKEFRGQDGVQKFGSVTISYTY